jgi:hypothetical protein
MTQPRILALWSAPRSMSTAFFRMMMERGDFQMLHEPFSYLAEFGSVDVAGVEVRTEPGLIARIRELARLRPVFFKDTMDERYPAVVTDRDFLAQDAVHTFLVRDPLETIASYHRINPRLRPEQIGFGHQLELFEAVSAATGRLPLVMDAHQLIGDPAATVRNFCANVGIEFRPEALSWSPGARQEWGPSAKWHAEVSRSSGFSSRPADPEALRAVLEDARLAQVLALQRPFYDQLKQHVTS